jgi:hypothetical protein
MQILAAACRELDTLWEKQCKRNDPRTALHNVKVQYQHQMMGQIMFEAEKLMGNTHFDIAKVYEITRLAARCYYVHYWAKYKQLEMRLGGKEKILSGI